MNTSTLAATVAAALCLSAWCLVATPASAASVTRSLSFDGEASALWEAVGDFCAIADWHPAVTSCEEADHGGTMRRTLTLDGGGTLVEDLLDRDDAAMSYSYAIVDGPLPVADYESTISVSPDGGEAAIEWSGTFEPKNTSEAEAEAVIAGIYEAGLEGIVASAQR